MFRLWIFEKFVTWKIQIFQKSGIPAIHAIPQPEGRGCFYWLPPGEFNKTKVELINSSFLFDPGKLNFVAYPAVKKM